MGWGQRPVRPGSSRYWEPLERGAEVHLGSWPRGPLKTSVWTEGDQVECRDPLSYQLSISQMGFGRVWS